jgi:hypothetical protein
MLARHVAHLFSRDPLVVFRNRTSEVDDHESTEHFENLQSTNWQTVRAWRHTVPTHAHAQPSPLLHAVEPWL